MNHPDNAIPTAEMGLSGFLHMLFDNIEGYIYTPTLNRETGEFNPIFVKSTNIERLIKHIEESSRSTDVYLAPSVFSEPKATKKTFAATNVVWCEFDGSAPVEFTDTPTVRIRSSAVGFEHCYWRLDEPITDYSVLEEINRGLAFTMNADKSGWDATQILRPPSTFNYKRNLPVGIIETTGNIYNVGDFTSYSAPKQLTEDSIKLGQVPDVMDVVFKYAFPEDFRDIFSLTPAEGLRSTYMMRVGYVAAEIGCTNEEIYALIRNFDDRIKKYTDRQDRHRRLLDIIERVRIKYPLESEVQQDETFDSIEILDIISFGNQEYKIEWLIPSLLQKQGNLLLCGPPGVGKTQVALNFAYGLATGQSVLDYDLEPCRILFISCEMGPVDLKVFTDQMTQQYKDSPDALSLLSENFFVYPHGEPMYLNTKTAQEQLIRMADVLRIDGFIFDSLGSATSKSLTDEEATKGLLDFNDRLRKELGIFSWFIHHNRKATENNKEPSGLADVYGSQYITARATTVLSLWPQSSSVLKVRELKKRLAPQEEDWYIKRGKNLHFLRASKSEIATVATKKSTLGKLLNDDKSNPFGI